MTTSITSLQDLEHTARLLHFFDAESLGDGNMVAGANVLAAMALTISNVQRPGSAVIGADGFRTPLGCSLAASGALTSSLVADLVLAPLQAAQNNVFANVRDWEEDEKRRREQLVRTGREADDEPENPPTPALADLDRDAMLGEAEHITRGLRLLSPPPRFGFQEIGRHPLFFAVAGSPKTFRCLMESAHLGRPLVHVALTAVADCPVYQKSAGLVMNGCQLFEPDIRSVRGELIVTDPANVLGEALRGGLAGSGWLGSLLCFSDHAAGPAFEAKAAAAAHAQFDRVASRFRNALKQSLAERLSAGDGEPATLDYNLRGDQGRWVEFLVSLEPSFPGITGTLRALPASLFYGLHRIRIASKQAENEPAFAVEWVYAFARVLARRMVNARELMLRDSRRARLEALGEMIRRKLADGPLTVRELTRKSHRLSASDCEDALEYLMVRGFVKRSGNAWGLRQAVITTTPCNSVPPQSLTLDV